MTVLTLEKPDNITPDWAGAEVASERAHARIADLKARAGDDLLIFGSHILFNGLLVHGLVDELTFWSAASYLVTAYARSSPACADRSSC